MASDAPASALRQVFEARISQLTAEVEDLFDAGRERSRSDLAEQLNQAVRRLRQASGSEELAATLVDAAGLFASGAALFRIEGDTARGERVRGVAELAAESFPGTSIPLTAAPALAGAVETREPVTAVAAPSEVSATITALAGHAPEARVSIYPLQVRERVAALLYTWGEVQGALAELLCQVAAAVWTGMEPLPAPQQPLVQIGTAEPAPETAEPAAAARTWDSLPSEEQRVHLRAQRFARVHVAEMRLHEGQAVQTGRARGDLYGALRSSIDSAREKFRAGFFAPCPSMVDYLHLELVRTLAHDDPEILGKDYPGPLV
jgi:hypothetical protein